MPQAETESVIGDAMRKYMAESKPQPLGQRLFGLLGFAADPGILYRVGIDRAQQIDAARRLAAAIESGTLEISSLTVMGSGELRIGIKQR